MTWFIVLMIHGCATASCPQTPYPVTIAMPNQEVCIQVRDLNAEKLPAECWAKPK